MCCKTRIPFFFFIDGERQEEQEGDVDEVPQMRGNPRHQAKGFSQPTVRQARWNRLVRCGQPVPMNSAQWATGKGFECRGSDGSPILKTPSQGRGADRNRSDLWVRGEGHIDEGRYSSMRQPCGLRATRQWNGRDWLVHVLRGRCTQQQAGLMGHR